MPVEDGYVKYGGYAKRYNVIASSGSSGSVGFSDGVP
jgi:hypothetical protein